MQKIIEITKERKEIYSATKLEAPFGQWCNAPAPESYWNCSRIKNHKCLRHVAHGGGMVLLIWED